MMCYHEVEEMARRAAYDSQGEAHIKIEHILWSGSSTVQLKVHRVCSVYTLVSCRLMLIKYAASVLRQQLVKLKHQS